MSFSAALKNDETVRTIVKAAAESFAEDGFVGARVDDIARRARINKALLYYYVGDKAALYALVLLQAFQQAGLLIDEAIDPGSAPEDQLRSAIGAIARTAAANPAFPRLMLREITAGGTNLPEPVLKAMAHILDTICRILKQGSDDGSFRNVNPLMTHIQIVGSILFLSTAERTAHRIIPYVPLPPEELQPFAAEAIARQVADTVLIGIKTPGSKESIACPAKK